MHISQILHLKGDRQDFDFVKSSLSAAGFDVVYDINGEYDSKQSLLVWNSWPELILKPFYVIPSSGLCFAAWFSGREAVEVEPIIDALPKLEQ